MLHTAASVLLECLTVIPSLYMRQARESSHCVAGKPGTIKAPLRRWLKCILAQTLWEQREHAQYIHIRG